MSGMLRSLQLALLVVLLHACAATPDVATERFDVIVQGGIVYDGRGSIPRNTDPGIRGDRVAYVGDLSRATAGIRLDARGLAVTPGFIDVLSRGYESLVAGGRSQSDIRQGVTLESCGEGWSMGPLNDAMKAQELRGQSDIEYPIEWTALGEYLQWRAARGISTNVAS